MIPLITAKIEFLSELKEWFHNVERIPMNEIGEMYKDKLSDNGAEDTSSRIDLKLLVQDNISYMFL